MNPGWMYSRCPHLGFGLIHRPSFHFHSASAPLTVDEAVRSLELGCSEAEKSINSGSGTPAFISFRWRGLSGAEVVVLAVSRDT